MGISIFRDWDAVVVDERVRNHVALGVFDGVHVGHQAVIGAALAERERRGGAVGVVTFEPHPIRVLAPEKAPAALLATFEHKAHLLEKLGVDWLFVVDFTEEFARCEAGCFLEKLANFAPLSLAVGEDWRFGKGRFGDTVMLERWCGWREAVLHALPPVLHDGERVSSTRIRQAIRDGNFAAVTQMLGMAYVVEGRVVHGQGLARGFGFPTANLDFGAVQMPSDGVWAVRARVFGEGAWLPAVANLGVRPTVGGAGRVFEVHLLGISRDLYGEILEVQFEGKLREERKFVSLEELREQISRDVGEAREMFGV